MGLILFGFFVFGVIWCYRRFKFEQPPEEDEGEGGGGGRGPRGPRDDSDLPPLPIGSGPIPHRVPDSWVQEFQEYRARIMKKIKDESEEDPEKEKDPEPARRR